MFHKMYYRLIDDINNIFHKKFYSEYHNIFPQHISKEFWHICNIITEIIPLYIFAEMNTDSSIDNHRIKKCNCLEI